MEGALIDTALDHSVVREQVTRTLKRLSRTGALPTLPTVASAALGMVRDPEADIDRLCRVIQTDVGLAARVLRIANSAALGRRSPARKLSEAVITVGLRKTCDVLVAACARQLYDTSSPLAERLWTHALATAVASEELAKRSRRIDPGRAFLPGLFHDVGRIAFLLADETSLEVVDRMVIGGDGPRTLVESEWYGFDHGEASASLVEEWGLALEQCDGIRWHHDPASAGAAHDLAAILNAADAIAYEIGCGGADVQPEEISFASVSIPEDDVPDLIEKIRHTFEEHRQILS